MQNSPSYQQNQRAVQVATVVYPPKTAHSWTPGERRPSRRSLTLSIADELGAILAPVILPLAVLAAIAGMAWWAELALAARLAVLLP